MILPKYAAEVSLYTTSRSYRRAHGGPASAAGPPVVAQQDPCAIGGGGRRPSSPERLPAWSTMLRDCPERAVHRHVRAQQRPVSLRATLGRRRKVLADAFSVPPD